MAKLERKLPIEKSKLINAQIPPSLAQGNDTFKRKHTENGHFNLASAYDVIAGRRNSGHYIFRILWKRRGTVRIRLSLWKVAL